MSAAWVESDFQRQFFRYRSVPSDGHLVRVQLGFERAHAGLESCDVRHGKCIRKGY